MNTRTFDAIAIITAVILIPMVASSAHAYWSGKIDFAAYVAMWREPVALLLGFWLRGAREE